MARADALRRRGAFDEALAAYEEALRQDPASVRAHVGLQTVMEELGLVFEMRRLYADNPTHRAYVRARLLPHGSRRERLVAMESEPWRSLGRGLWEGSTRRRRADLERAVRLDPGSSWAQLAAVPLASGRDARGRAQVALEAAAWSDPGHPLPHLWRSALEDRRGRLDAALVHALAAWERAPADQRIARRLFDVAQRMGRQGMTRAARALEQRAGALGGVAAWQAAELHARMGDKARADEWFERARTLGVTAAEVSIARARREAPAVANFVRAFRRGVEGRYRHYAATGEADSLAKFRDWARGLFRTTTGVALAPRGKIKSFAFIGELVDPSVDSDEPLVRALAQHNLLLILGRRRGGPPEALLAEIERRTPRRDWTVRGDTVSCEVAWIGRRLVDGYLEWAGGGDLAGLALPGIVLVDLHASALWEGEQRRRRAILARTHARWRGQLALVRGQRDDVRAVDDPAGVADRLLYTAALGFADEVLVHELAHLVDAQRHLPVPRHPLRNLRLAVERGFSQREILSFLERNAQLAAMTDGRTPRQALGVCCSFLGGEGEHARGYAEIVRGIVSVIVRHPERFPAIDSSRVIVQQLDRLTDRQIRSAAQALARRWGLGANAQPMLQPRAPSAEANPSAPGTRPS